jgi:hypothetical protein
MDALGKLVATAALDAASDSRRAAALHDDHSISAALHSLCMAAEAPHSGGDGRVAPRYALATHKTIVRGNARPVHAQDDGTPVVVSRAKRRDERVWEAGADREAVLLALSKAHFRAHTQQSVLADGLDTSAGDASRSYMAPTLSAARKTVAGDAEAEAAAAATAATAATTGVKVLGAGRLTESTQRWVQQTREIPKWVPGCHDDNPGEVCGAPCTCRHYCQPRVGCLCTL